MCTVLALQKIGVLIIDDHPTVRLGLEAILNRFEDIEVLATAEDGESGIERCRTVNPAVVLVDIHMPGMDGIATITRLKQEFPQLRSIALTHSEDDETILNAVDAGVFGFLVKTAPVTEIAAAIRAAAAGRRWLAPQAMEAIIRAKTALPAAPDMALTKRELDIMSLMAKGLTNPQISETVHISVSTVKFHIGVIFKKLGAHTRTEAVMIALEKGIVKR